jgi:cytochrome c556
VTTVKRRASIITVLEKLGASMNRSSRTSRILVVMLSAAAGVALAADAPPASGPGWTGVTNPKDVIYARQELMEEIEKLMEPIDTVEVKGVHNPDGLRASAATISAMLLAVPHLFPPTTDRFDPKVTEPETLALPGIWKDFGSFYKLAAAASKAAVDMSETQSNPALKAAGLKLRASCDACHALYLRPYAPPKVLDSDRNFDFDSAFPKK